MKFVKALILMPLFILFFPACSSLPESSSYQRQWMLTEMKGFTKDQLVKSKAYIDFSPTKSPKNHYSAYMGCNRLFLTAVFGKNQNVKFSNVGGTMMYCSEFMELEGAFAKYLPGMTIYKISGHELLLSDGKENIMKFIAADWD